MPMQKVRSKLELFSEELEAEEGARPDGLTVFVAGASGDLAKKKTYPSLFDLHRRGFLPEHLVVCGYARSPKTDEAFREGIEPHLRGGTDGERAAFLSRCAYRRGAYDSPDDVAAAFDDVRRLEEGTGCARFNRLFYLAVPPSVFVPIGRSLKGTIDAAEGDPRAGWSRLIVEKPFGRDSESFRELNSAMGALYAEDRVYRIDHYLGKEMVQNLVILRFANAIFEPLWNRNHIKMRISMSAGSLGASG